MKDKKNESSETEFPGYPHYPAKEDIMNANDERIEIDVENFSRSRNVPSTLPDNSANHEQAEQIALPDAEDEIRESEISDADLNKDDLLALGDKDGNFVTAENLTGSDLDVPGSEEDDANEEIGEEDEENNYYSLGGDAHEDLEEDKGD